MQYLKLKRLLTDLIFPLASFFSWHDLNAQSPADTLGLEQTIRVGLTNATEVLKDRNIVEQAGAQLLYAYGQFLPNLIFEGNYSYAVGNSLLTTEPVIATSNRSIYNYQLTSNINIYSGQYNRANLKASVLSRQSTQLSLQWARQEVAIDIIQSFLQIMLDKKLVEIQTDNLNISLRREDQIQALVQAGRLTPVDLYQQQAETSQDQADLSNAQNQLRSDKILLLSKLRLNERDSLDKYEFGTIPLNSEAQPEKYGDELVMVDEALKGRSDLQAYKLNVDAADWNIRKYQSGYLPKISLGIGAYNSGLYYDYLYYDHKAQTPDAQNNIGYQLTHQIYALAGINATWNIFDNYFTRSNVIIAKTQYSNAKIDYRDQQIQIISDIRQAYGNYKNDLQLIETNEKGITAAQKAFDAMQGRYTQGAASFIDVLTTQRALLNAKQSQIHAIISLTMEEKSLDYLTGTQY